MHIPSHIPREHVHLQPRVCKRLLAADTAFPYEVAVRRHTCFHVGSVVVARMFRLHASG